MLEQNPQDDEDVNPLDTTAKPDADETVLQSELVHSHLPKLEDMGYIEWDRDTGKIRKGPNWNEIAPLLELIHDHQDELPDGWL
jgi:hypothetical protein